MAHIEGVSEQNDAVLSQLGGGHSTVGHRLEVATGDGPGEGGLEAGGELGEDVGGEVGG